MLEGFKFKGLEGYASPSPDCSPGLQEALQERPHSVALAAKR